MLAHALTLIVLAGFDKFLIKIARAGREMSFHDRGAPHPMTSYSHQSVEKTCVNWLVSEFGSQKNLIYFDITIYGCTKCLAFHKCETK